MKKCVLVYNPNSGKGKVKKYLSDIISMIKDKGYDVDVFCSKYKGHTIEIVRDINKADLCASFEKNVTETLLHNVEKAIKKTGLKTIALAGGVSANSYIRNAFKELEKDGIKVYMPDLKLCTDNAAMIASAGYYNFIAGKRDTLDLNAIPNLKL